MIRKAIIPIAGYGTRMLPATLAVPKAMLNVYDKPVIEYIIEEITKAGITEILLITNLGSDILEKQFSRNYELESFLETNGQYRILEKVKSRYQGINIYLKKASTNVSMAESILDARGFVGNEPFLLVLGDEIFYDSCSKLLVDKYNELKTPIIAVKHVEKKDINNYGIVEVKSYKKDLYIIERMIEKPIETETNSDIAIIGRYILNPSIFDSIQEQVESSKQPNFTKALQNTKEIKFALNVNFDRFDCGNKLGLLVANIEFALKNNSSKGEVEKILKELYNKYKL